MRITFPLLGQFLDLFFSNLAVISLNQLRLNLAALHACLSGLGAQDSGEVWNIARALVSLQVDILTEASTFAAIFPLVVLSATDPHLDL